MDFKNLSFFHITHACESPHTCLVKDAAANTTIDIIPDNGRVVLFSGTQDLVYLLDDSHVEEVDRLEESSYAYLDDLSVFVDMPTVEPVNTLVELDEKHISHKLKFSLQSLAAQYVLAYYELIDTENCYNITHKYAVVDNGSVTIDSNSEKLVYVYEIPEPGKPYKPSFTTGSDTMPIRSSNVITISSPGKAYVIVVEYQKDPN